MKVEREKEKGERVFWKRVWEFWEKIFYKKFHKYSPFVGLLIKKQSYLFREFMSFYILYFFVYINLLRCKDQGATNREKLHGMHDVRLLLVFPFVGRIPDTWPTLLRRNSRNTRSRSHLLVSKSPICVRWQEVLLRVMTLQKFFRSAAIGRVKRKRWDGS